MANLITVPTFEFPQGEIGGDDFEAHINVQYYDGIICLEQNGNEVLILPAYFEALVKEIRKHKKEADAFLNKK